MRRTVLILVLIGLIAGAAGIYFKMKSFGGADHERFQQALHRLKNLDTTFDQGVLQARFAMLDNYDDFQTQEAELQSLLATLRNPPASLDPAGRLAISSAGLQLDDLLQKRHLIFERFKSQNAILANSRRYLPVALDELATRNRASPDRELDIVISEVARLTLVRLANPDELPADASDRLQHLRDWSKTHAEHPDQRFVASLAGHVEKIVEGSRAVDDLTRQLLALPSADGIERLSRAYGVEVTKSLQRERQYRNFLYVVGVVLLGVIGYMFWILRSANSQLEHRVLERTQDLARSEERFRTLCVASPLGIFMTDAAGRCVYANPAFQEVFGLTPHGSVTDLWANLLHAEDRQSVLAEWTRATAERQLFAREFRVSAGASETRWVSSRAIGLHASDGSCLGFVGTVENITDRKAAEAELAAAQKQLIETSRQAGMAEVATGVLHNVGNVLNSVNVSATLVAETLTKSKAANLSKVAALLEEHATDLGAFITVNPAGKQLPLYLTQLTAHLTQERSGLLKEIGELRSHIEHIRDIVAMQQSYAKVSGVIEAIKASELVEDALRLNAGSLNQQEVRVIRQFEADPTLQVDRHKVLQILVNLIRNAKYACEDSGRLDKQVTMRVALGTSQVKISVIDNGIGIPGENLLRIFNHGFTTRKGGHGFGLHSGALAARELGGLLHAHSDGPGCGATFMLELPVEMERRMAA
jgi:PAS domain S-box-containing protein